MLNKIKEEVSWANTFNIYIIIKQNILNTFFFSFFISLIKNFLMTFLSEILIYSYNAPSLDLWCFSGVFWKKKSASTSDKDQESTKMNAYN